MAHKVSFDELKALVSIEDCAAWLGLKFKNNRCDCPLCGKERSFTITPARGLFGCFGCQKRGSILDLVHLIRETANVRDAALLIQQHFLGDGTVNRSEPSDTVPTERTAQTRREDGEELKPLDYLEADHPIVEPLGLTPEVCQALGWGYAKKGTMRGRFLIALRTGAGKLVGYLGIATTEEMIPLLAFPRNLPQMLEQPAKPKEEASPAFGFLRVVK